MDSFGAELRDDKMTGADFAAISEDCNEKIRECEKELARMGCRDIALVAYQLKN